MPDPIHIGIHNASRPKFELGRLVATPYALKVLTQDDILWALGKHVQGDWGDMDKHDKQANNKALLAGERLFSVYTSLTSVKFWVITEADRSVTTVLLPEDY